MKSDQEFELWKQQWQGASAAVPAINLQAIRDLPEKVMPYPWWLMLASALILFAACAGIPLAMHLDNRETAVLMAIGLTFLLSLSRVGWSVYQSRFLVLSSTSSFIRNSLRHAQTNLRVTTIGIWLVVAECLGYAIWTTWIARHQDTAPLLWRSMIVPLGIGVIVLVGLARCCKQVQVEATYLQQVAKAWDEDQPISAAWDSIEKENRGPLLVVAKNPFTWIERSFRPSGPRKHLNKQRNKRRKLL